MRARSRESRVCRPARRGASSAFSQSPSPGLSAAARSCLRASFPQPSRQLHALCPDRLNCTCTHTPGTDLLQQEATPHQCHGPARPDHRRSPGAGLPQQAAEAASSLSCSVGPSSPAASRQLQVRWWLAAQPVGGRTRSLQKTRQPAHHLFATHHCLLRVGWWPAAQPVGGDAPAPSSYVRLLLLIRQAS